MIKYTVEQAAEGLLKTDIGLIDANDTHAVFSVRLRRDFIADNHNILNVLSDLAGDSGSSPKTKPQLKNRTWMLGAAFLVGLLVPSSLFDLIHHAVARSTPPVDVQDTRMLTPVVPIGGELILSAMTHRTRVCPTQVYRSILRDSDGALIDQMNVPAEVADVTERPVLVRVAVRLPKDVEPGKYHYHARLVSTCDGEMFMTKQPNLPFEVVPTDDFRIVP